MFNIAYDPQQSVSRELGWGSPMDCQFNDLLDLSLDFEARKTAKLLDEIIQKRQLNTLFQPIINIQQASIWGHEGLTRGPADSILHAPLSLFEAARSHGVALEIEHLSRQVVLESFAKAASQYRLFLNVSPECLIQSNSINGATLRYIKQLGLDPHHVVIELTESSPTFDYQLLRQATQHYRNMGFQIAIDDLGEGFSSLRLWSELQPDYVKIDKHFISGINADPVKLQFVKSIQQIAENSGAKIIAEGIETQEQLMILKEIRVDFGQGYFLGRPAAHTTEELPAPLKEALRKKYVGGFRSENKTRNQEGLSKLIHYITPVTPKTTNDEVYRAFENDPNLYSIPVVDYGKPIGLISRYSMIDRFARPYRRELYGKRACDVFMDDRPLIVEKTMRLHELSELITNMEPHHLSNGFIVVDDANYIGIGSGHGLLREITQMQLNAARYANPLTQLPGNVPINEHIDRLLHNNATFWACYCDLDNFKPFNDAYGFKRGDELIQMTGKLLSDTVSNEQDFIGHIGGDDFILLFQSENWQQLCQSILDTMQLRMPEFYDPKDRLAGGIHSEDRVGNKVFYPFGSLSIGAVKVEPDLYNSHHEVAAAMTLAKKQAKNLQGNSLFFERRLP